jgi:hypothetical protein
MGVGAPVVSTVEDGVSLSLSFIAILLPLLVLVVLAGFAALFWRFWQRRARRRNPQPADR